MGAGGGVGLRSLSVLASSDWQDVFTISWWRYVIMCISMCHSWLGLERQIEIEFGKYLTEVCII